MTMVYCLESELLFSCDLISEIGRVWLPVILSRMAMTELLSMVGIEI